MKCPAVFIILYLTVTLFYDRSSSTEATGKTTAYLLLRIFEILLRNDSPWLMLSDSMRARMRIFRN
jgi:hypothetical protein